MIEYRKGNVLEADVEALVNSVNCVGVMGRGIALQFKQAWPDNFKEYVKACSRKEVQPGKMFVYETGRLTNPRYIINFPTKRHWRSKSRIEDIEAGLQALREEIAKRGIKSLALPPLGSGLGGLDWKEVRPLIENALKDLRGVHIVVYEPLEKEPLPRSVRRGTPPKMTQGRAVLVSLIDRYLQGLLAPSITLLEVHKLMYFAQEAGLPLKLRYVKAPYGPYAENLRHVLKSVDSYFISGYGVGGDQPNKVIELVPGALEDAQRALDSAPDAQERLQRVAELVEGFESPHGLELLATVHWIAIRDKPVDLDELEWRFYEWAPRKKSNFTSRQIRIAASTLANRGWIDDKFISTGPAGHQVGKH
ncbi:type II toxin-antitoxin system antitoxin DNA ADP-ribosyl glycohydrolase DarG [Oceanithermus desulfurans]|uniref:Appr-1-p processing protein n=2 Tax=Oceanithermus desulfurans TaxID=227924 RepID=A0A511RK80_9DEIN|nr:macro domain-containing protein [Oceanithermus desulfurans]MBB6030542.1 O-acetyl-ADP-ribose deacetylase (regulator of RNase III) [Oceanithermus desulfurans]GEM90048.1 Appr-1-p processing protein [Oceanithermus desulfurans NBRC 100063]